MQYLYHTSPLERELLANFDDYLGQNPAGEMRASLKAAALVNRSDEDVQTTVDGTWPPPKQ